MMAFRGTAADTVVSAAAVVSDPALPEVVRLIRQIHEAEKASAPPSKPGTKPPSYSAGVGLSAAIGPLKVILYARRNPWVVPAAAAALLAVPLFIGFSLGRSSKRSP